MGFFLVRTSRLAAAVFLFLSPGNTLAQKRIDDQKHVPRRVWNFDGGVFFQTDGGIHENVCFRLAGRVTAPHFFDDLKRIDDDFGTQYRRGKESVATFPDELNLIFVIHDFPCTSQQQTVGERVYLTRGLMSTLHLSLYWKHGIALRPVENVTRTYFSVDPVVPYAGLRAHDLPQKLEWRYSLAVHSADVPLTDSLVLLLRDANNHIVARVAARM